MRWIAASVTSNGKSSLDDIMRELVREGAGRARDAETLLARSSRGRCNGGRACEVVLEGRCELDATRSRRVGADRSNHAVHARVNFAAVARQALSSVRPFRSGCRGLRAGRSAGLDVRGVMSRSGGLKVQTSRRATSGHPAGEPVSGAAAAASRPIEGACPEP